MLCIMAAINCILSSFKSVSKDLTSYLGNDNEQNTEVLSLLQQVFEYNKKDENVSGRMVEQCPLTELETEDFDDEQIWQQIQLQNESLLAQSLKRIKRLVKEKDVLCFSNDNGVKMLGGNVEKNHGDDDDEINYDNFNDNDDDEEINYDNIDDDDVVNNDDYEDVDLNDDSLKNKRSSRSDNDTKQKASIVDDQFFKLSEMEKFLEMEEKRDENDDSNDGIDLFMDYNKETNNDDDDDVDLSRTKLSSRQNDKEKKDPSNYMYEDFFDVPVGVSKKNKKDKDDNRFVQDNDEDSDDNNDDNDDNSDDNDDNSDDNDDEMSESYESEKDLGTGSEHENDHGKKSTFEKQQDRVKKKIKELENSNVTEKPWQLVGEASASLRPPNSLLEEMVYFDHTTAAVPVVTEETSLQLEDIIKQRIKDQTWDDVERKEKPVKEPYVYKKAKPLNHEKSKMSLSEIYEKEYLAQKEPVAEKTNEEHAEIEKMMTALFSKLDALSNFHFTPKPLKPEVNIVANVGSVSIEESAPVTMSETNLLAPEEIFDKQKQEVKGATEQTKEDRKHERRLKKKRQHLAAKAKEKKLEKKHGLGNKYTKEKMKKSKTVNNNDEGNEDKKSFSSSSAFFAKLQDSVRNEIQEKKSVAKKKKNGLHSAQVKL